MSHTTNKCRKRQRQLQQLFLRSAHPVSLRKNFC